MKKKIAILGSTGSIGGTTLDIISKNKKKLGGNPPSCGINDILLR